MASPINIRIAANDDDCYAYMGSSVIGLSGGEYLGNDGSAIGSGLRFLGVTIPSGQTVDTAYIVFTSAGNQGADTVRVKISAEQNVAAATFTTYADYAARVLTTAQVDWDFTTDWATNTEYNSADIKSVIQELLTDYGELNNANIAIFVRDDGSDTGAWRQGYGQNSSPTKCALLHIEYSPTPLAPTVTTQAVSDIGKTTATGNGNVTSDGGSAITERGVCYCEAAHGTPDTGDDKDTAAGTTGAFTTSMTGLSHSTDYHARAYATNSIGTSYGETVDFTTDIAATYVEILTKDLVDDTAGGTNTSTYPVSTNVHYDHCQAADPHPGYVLESSHNTVTIQTTTYTVLSTDNLVVCNSTTAFTVTLPAASGSGKIYHIKNINSGTVTLEGNSSDTIDGDLNVPIIQWDDVSVIDYAANKWVIV
jgi:hypothetical protein